LAQVMDTEKGTPVIQSVTISDSQAAFIINLACTVRAKQRKRGNCNLKIVVKKAITL